MTIANNDILSRLRNLDNSIGRAYIAGVLDTLESIAAGVAPTVGARAAAVQPACANVSAAVDPAPVDDEIENPGAPVETLKDIDAAVENLKKNNSENFRNARSCAVRKLWDFNMRRDLFDRLAAAVVLGVISKKVATQLREAVDHQKKENPAFTAFPFIANRLRAAFRASGYNWTPTSPDLEPAPKAIPFELTAAGKAAARLEAGAR